MTLEKSPAPPKQARLLEYAALAVFAASSLLKLSVTIFDPDTLIQLDWAAEYLRSGHFGRLVARSSDLAAPVFLKECSWPLTYSLVMAPVLRVLKDFGDAEIFMSRVAVLVFCAALFPILRIVTPKKRWWFAAALLAYWAFVSIPLTSGGTNMISMALFYAGLATALWSISSARRYVAAGLASGACVGLAAAFRYAYWPTLAVLPTAAAYCAWKLDRRLTRLAWAIGAASAAVWGASELFLFSERGSLYGNVDPRCGPYWGRLTKVRAFPAEAFRLPETLRIVCNVLGANVKTPAMDAALAVLSLAIVAAVGATCWRFMKPKGRTDARSKTSGAFFHVVALLMVAITPLFLLVLSLSQGPGIPSSYASTERYYMPLNSLIGIVIAEFLCMPELFVSTWSRRARAGLAVVLGLSLFAVAKSPLAGRWPPRESDAWVGNGGRKMFMRILDASAGERTIYAEITNSGPSIIRLAAANERYPVTDEWTFPVSFHTSAPLRLLIAVHAIGFDKETAALRAFISQHKHSVAGNHLLMEFWAVDIDPGDYVIG